MVPWKIGSPANGNVTGENETVTINPSGGIPGFRLAMFALNPSSQSVWTPLQVNYGDPTFLHLNNTGPWNSSAVVLPEDFTATDWVRISTRVSLTCLGNSI